MRERIRFHLPSVIPTVELNGLGNDVDSPLAANALYSRFRIHVVASILAEAVEDGGIVYANLPRNLN